MKKILRIIRKPILSNRIKSDQKRGYCYACGNHSNFTYKEVITDDLARQWEVGLKDRHSFSSRESRQCEHCGCTYRNRQLAKALCYAYRNFGKPSNMAELVNNEKFRTLNVAEINACGGLHQFLVRLPNLRYSEYQTKDKNIHSEDIHSLSYKDNFFDLVLTSETLEHIPDYKQAIREIHRVLKPEGWHIFTIPIIWGRKTRRRAEYEAGGKKVKHLLEPSHHGLAQEDNLVWTEFGGDSLELFSKSNGFDTKLFYYNMINRHDSSCVFISTKIK